MLAFVTLNNETIYWTVSTGLNWFIILKQNYIVLNERVRNLGRGGGLVFSTLAFYSDDASLNPAEVYGFFFKISFVRNKNK